jgi:hypothetical protein
MKNSKLIHCSNQAAYSQHKGQGLQGLWLLLFWLELHFKTNNPTLSYVAGRAPRLALCNFSLYIHNAQSPCAVMNTLCYFRASRHKTHLESLANLYMRLSSVGRKGIAHLSYKFSSDVYEGLQPPRLPAIQDKYQQRQPPTIALWHKDRQNSLRDRPRRKVLHSAILGFGYPNPRLSSSFLHHGAGKPCQWQQSQIINHPCLLQHVHSTPPLIISITSKCLA